MKKVYAILAATAFLLLMAACGSRKSQAYYDYESKLIATELDGTYTIRAWGRARTAADAFEQARKQAVSDVIFKGVQAASSNLTDLKPILFDMNARTNHEDYFNRFFADGSEFNKYVSIRESRVMSGRYARTNTQVVAQITVCVDRAALKQKLIEDGILK